MSETTYQQQPTPQATCAALVALTAELARSAQHCEQYGRARTFPTLTVHPLIRDEFGDPVPMVYVGFGSDMQTAMTVVGGMTGTVYASERVIDQGQPMLQKTWRGLLAEGWHVCVIVVLPPAARDGDPAAGLPAVVSDESIGRPENIGTHPDAIPAGDPAAAPNPPGGPVSTWPPAAVPAPRTAWDDREQPRRAPSWSAIGSAPVPILPPGSLAGVTPRTDKALIEQPGSNA